MTLPHEFYMARALRLAEKGRYITHPNPRVGCVLVKDGRIVGEGHTQRAGADHAEVDALKKAGAAARGATAYVSMEPCCFQGRTGPCTQALTSAGVVTLVYGMEDPHPRVNGQGIQALREAGLTIVGPLLETSAHKLNPGFISVNQGGLPRVTCKLAMSLDGKIALANGDSQWITASAAREDVQRLRAASGAIVTGVQTVIHDDPSMTVRAAELGNLDPALARTAAEIARPRVVLDSSGRMPVGARIITGPQPTLVATTMKSHPLAGTEGLEIQTLAADTQGRVDLGHLLKMLAEKAYNEVLFECGPTLAGSLLQSGLLDELVVYVSGKVLGHQAKSLLETQTLLTLSKAQRMRIVDVRHLGGDLKLVWHPVD